MLVNSFIGLACLFVLSHIQPKLDTEVSRKNEYNRSDCNNISFVVDDARYSQLQILEDGDLLGAELCLYKIQGKIEGVVRYAEGTYMPPEVVTTTIECDNIKFISLNSYSFKGKISQYKICGVLYDREGNYVRDVVMNRQLTPHEPILIKINENKNIDGEYLNYSFDNQGGVHGVRIRIVGYGDDAGFVPYIQFANGFVGHIYIGKKIEYDGKAHISFNIDACGLKYKRIQADIYNKYMAATIIADDGTSTTLVLPRR